MKTHHTTNDDIRPAKAPLRVKANGGRGLWAVGCGKRQAGQRRVGGFWWAREEVDIKYPRGTHTLLGSRSAGKASLGWGRWLSITEELRVALAGGLCRAAMEGHASALWSRRAWAIRERVRKQGGFADTRTSCGLARWPLRWSRPLVDQVQLQRRDLGANWQGRLLAIDQGWLLLRVSGVEKPEQFVRTGRLLPVWASCELAQDVSQWAQLW